LVSIAALIDDTRYSSLGGIEPTQTISAAEYSLDAPPTSPSALKVPATPKDGAFDEPSEDVIAQIDTTSLAPGRHMVFVRGQDAGGHWGPPSAAFLYVLDPLTSPKIQGHILDAVTRAPLAATVSAGVFQTSSDPASGYYSMTVMSGTYTLTAAAEGYAPGSISGVVVQDQQVISQSFLLDPLCTIFWDDVEAGNVGWSAQSPWAITSEDFHSPSHSWTDSPGRDYSDSRNISLTSPAFNLSGYANATLSYWLEYDFEPVYDYGYVEYSTDGSHWSIIASYSGSSNSQWIHETLSIPALDGASSARIRFRLLSDSGVTANGWHLDDIILQGSGPACSIPAPPRAGFTADSTLQSGQTVLFQNTTSGTPPLFYQWSFGDGTGFSTLKNPSYTYAMSGTYTVTLVATNTLGSSSASRPISVLAPSLVPISAMTLTRTAPSAEIYPGDEIILSADLSPSWATRPYTYSIDLGDNTPSIRSVTSDDPLILSFSYASDGSYSFRLSVWNQAMSEPLTALYPIVVEALPSTDIFLPALFKISQRK